MEHTILEEGVTKTVFDNGVATYVNHTEQTVETEVGIVEPMSFTYQKGE